MIGVLILLVALVGLFAWGRSQPRPEGYALSDSPPPVSTPKAVVPNETTQTGADAGEEIQQTTLDARSRTDWVLFDLVRGEVVAGDLSSGGWDLAFRRTKLLTNSGVTNPSGPGGAFDMGEVPLETAVPPAAAAFVVDGLGGDDGDEPENAAAGHWFSYSFITHIVSVRPNTYLIKTGEDVDALIQFDSYYCEDETPACITFRYRLVPKVVADS